MTHFLRTMKCFLNYEITFSLFFVFQMQMFVSYLQ